jgi:F-type H+-transporting ATPase subunit b
MTHLILFGGIASDLGSKGKDIAQTFGLDWPHFIAQCISFSIVAGLLIKFAYDPILAVLAERRQRIADGLANADKIKTELARTETLQREVLDKANAQANKLIEEARAAAARVQEEETQKAILQAEQILSKAKEAAALERQKMLIDLRHEVLALVAQTTSVVAGKVLTADDQQRLAEETRRQLAA